MRTKIFISTSLFLLAMLALFYACSGPSPTDTIDIAAEPPGGATSVAKVIVDGRDICLQGDLDPGVTIDGNTNDWNLSDDFASFMWEAGNPDKDLLSKMYMRYDCTNEKLYVLVLVEDDLFGEKNENDAWIKIYDLGQNTQTWTQFAWVGATNGTVDGFEGCISLAPGGDYSNPPGIEVHINIVAADPDEGARTSSTGRPEDNRPGLVIKCDVVPPEPEEQCETAYAFGGDDADCFINFEFSNWGWSNGPLAPDVYEFDIYAGAGQCDINKGTLVGTLTIDYDGSSVTVIYSLTAGFTMDETHLYVGSEPERFPKNKKGSDTVAPGQYSFQHDLNDATSDTYTVDASGNIFVIAHAVVCGDPDLFD